MIIAVVDGMGGGIGAQIVTQLRQELPLEVQILALGTNSNATQKMMKARASRGASGENAIRVSINQADVVLGPIGVVVPNSMMGEITPAIAESVATARGIKLLLPLNQPHLEVVGVESKPLTRLIGQAIDIIKARFSLSPFRNESFQDLEKTHAYPPVKAVDGKQALGSFCKRPNKARARVMRLTRPR